MKAFGYSAYTDAGKLRRGTIVAESAAEASAQLAAKGLYVSDLSLKSEQAGNSARSGFVARFGRARLDGALQVVFTRQMAVLLASELPLEAALEAVRQSGDPKLEAMAARARAALLDGAPLAEALQLSGGGFPPYYVAAVSAGEAGSDLARVFGELADFLESRGEDRARIATALIYPCFVAAVALLVSAILITTVAPEIVSLYALSDRPLPELTQVVLAISDWLQDHWVWVLAAFLALVVMWIGAGQNAALRHRRDGLLLRLPLVGAFLQRAEAVQYLRALALMLSARQPVPHAVASAADVLQMQRFRHQGQSVVTALEQGEGLSQAMEHLAVVPPVARQLIQAGEASARLALMVGRAAELVENSLTNDRRRLAALLEPALMILVGAAVLVIVLAVLLPIFDLQSFVAG